MKEESKNPEQPVLSAGEKKSKFNPKVLIIGLPVFIVQLVLVYFITANFLVNKSASSTHEAEPKEHDEQVEEKKESSEKPAVEVILNIDDMIVNPAGTNGKMLLLASLGLAVDKEDSKKELEQKQVIVKDVILSVLSARTIDQLNQSTYRDSLKTDIINRLAAHVPNIKISNVYFSKFIIQ
ncbi:MAG: flagellar basal body-associated FliL family protein [Ignavibacteriaceae bacterium]|nr:flagellar basal body-associated FliL family protein [Ignavibacteriaceae bacterium]